MKLIVKESNNLLDYLLNNTDYNKTKIKSLFKYKNIYLNNKNPLSLKDLVKKKDIIEIKKNIKQVKINNIDIIYEDNNYLVVNKPSGMLTISTDKEKNRTLYHFVREYVNSKQKKEKIFIVHRLDKETSGIVLFCKNEKLRDKLQEKWNDLVILREYHAVVKGLIPKEKDTLEFYLKENSINKVFVSNSKNGKLSITNYTLVKKDKNSLLKLDIKSGRKNQIRVSLSHIGYPILGDMKYGNYKYKRLLLCSNKLVFKDILTNKVLSFEINIPREFYKSLSI